MSGTFYSKQRGTNWIDLWKLYHGSKGQGVFTVRPRGNREVDFVKMRQMLAKGLEWNDDMHKAISPQYQDTKA